MNWWVAFILDLNTTQASTDAISEQCIEPQDVCFNEVYKSDQRESHVVVENYPFGCSYALLNLSSDIFLTHQFHRNVFVGKRQLVAILNDRNMKCVAVDPEEYFKNQATDS